MHNPNQILLTNAYSWWRWSWYYYARSGKDLSEVT